jgi:hypothetical protein
MIADPPGGGAVYHHETERLIALVWRLQAEIAELNQEHQRIVSDQQRLIADAILQRDELARVHRWPPGTRYRGLRKAETRLISFD